MVFKALKGQKKGITGSKGYVPVVVGVKSWCVSPLSILMLVFPPLSTVALVLLCPDPFSVLALSRALTMYTKMGLIGLSGLKGQTGSIG